jgi:hypothetical protein
MKISLPSMAFAAALTFGLTACSNTDTQKTVQHNNAPNGMTVADLIDNPVTADQPSDTVNVAKITFTEASFDFGKAKADEVVKHSFVFKNTGNVPLLIREARSTCGCTVPEFPKDPIPVGGSGEINVKFNTAGKDGRQKKPIIITANTFPTEKEYVFIEGDVIGEKGTAKATESTPRH